MIVWLIRSSPIVLLTGCLALLLGLGWDVVLHEMDPSLAAREGVMAMGNPGHAIFAVGVALVVFGTALLLLGRVRESSAARARVHRRTE